METVLHVSSPDPRDQQHAMVNTRNLLEDESVSPHDAVAVVANGAAVRMFLEATTPNRELIEELSDRGVTFLACRNALRGVGASDDELLSGVEAVPTGVGALASMQADGYGYLKVP